MLITSIGNIVNDSGGSKAMNVDGSSVVKTFTYSPGTGNAALLVGISILMENAETATLTNFGNIDGLSNGILIELGLNGNVHTLTNIQDNADLCTRFKRNYFSNHASPSLFIPPEFDRGTDLFVGTLDLHNPIGLVGNDFIRVTIRDDLSDISYLQMSYSILAETT